MTALTVDDPVLLAFADEVGSEAPVTVVGGRTRWALGGAVDPSARHMTAPGGVVRYQPAEMTVVVRAGTPVAELHAELAAAGQRTGLPERGGTVGGAVVVGENAMCVLGRGSVANAVLQVRYVSAEGRVVTGGGPVVKNVSGFNLPKLIVGSLGTLGLVIEVVLRTNPIPQASRWFRADGIDPVAVHNAVLRPSAVLWDGETTSVQLEGYGADVEAEAATLRDLGAFTEVDAPPQLPEHRWSLTPSEAAATTAAIHGSFVASIGVGTVWSDSVAPQRQPDAASQVVSDRMKQLFDPTGRLNPGRRPA